MYGGPGVIDFCYRWGENTATRAVAASGEITFDIYEEIDGVAC